MLKVPVFIAAGLLLIGPVAGAQTTSKSPAPPAPPPESATAAKPPAAPDTTAAPGATAAPKPAAPDGETESPPPAASDGASDASGDYPPGYGPPPGYVGPPADPSAPYGYSLYQPSPHAPHPYAEPFEDSGSFVHDGFYLQLSGGLSYMHLYESQNGVRTATWSGVGGAFDLTVGGAVWPGLIVAGMLQTMGVNEPELTAAEGRSREGTGTQTDKRLNLAIISLLVDYYPNPRRGFHFGGAVGVGQTRVIDSATDTADAANPGGAAISLHAGYEWWISNNWSLGVVARLTMVNLNDQLDDVGALDKWRYKQSGFIPTLSAGFTFN